MAAECSHATARKLSRDEFALCERCGDIVCFDDGRLRSLTGLEFEALPNQILITHRLLLKARRLANCGDPAPAYARTVIALESAAIDWLGEHRGAMLVFNLPTEDAYIPCLLHEVIRTIAAGCPDTRAFLESIDAATGSVATLSQFRVLAHEVARHLPTAGDA